MASNSFQHRRPVQAVADVNPISAEEVLRIGAENDVQYRRTNWHNTKLIVKTCIGPDEFMETIHNILDYCRDEDGEFAAEMIDFAERANIVAAYALLELPKDFEALFRLMYASDLYETVCDAVCTAQIDAIKRSIRIYTCEV